MPAWFAALPAEIRDALRTHRTEVIPERYRFVIEQWNLYLQREARGNR